MPASKEELRRARAIVRDDIALRLHQERFMAGPDEQAALAIEAILSDPITRQQMKVLLDNA